MHTCFPNHNRRMSFISFYHFRLSHKKLTLNICKVIAVVASCAHNSEVVGSIPTLATLFLMHYRNIANINEQEAVIGVA